jgi:putative flippase GtrA
MLFKKRKLKKKERRELVRIVEYLVSGGAFFWSGYIALIVFKAGFGFSLWWATSLSYLIGWTVNYLLQRFWVFKNPRLAKHELEVTGRYLLISFVNLFINFAILWSLESIGIVVYIGQFISAGFFTVWNYLWYKYYVFPEKFPRKKVHADGKPPRRKRVSKAATVRTPTTSKKLRNKTATYEVTPVPKRMLGTKRRSK